MTFPNVDPNARLVGLETTEEDKIKLGNMWRFELQKFNMILSMMGFQVYNIKHGTSDITIGTRG